MTALLIIGGALLAGGIFIAFAAGSSAAQSERIGKYELTMGGYGSYLALAGTQYAWMWVGVAAASLGGLILLGVLFINAAKRS